ncbi:hypothetical protein A2110_00875 [Candidatus Jorgensenbacteria bacterium GWA1_54_12]|uniref:Single-stranded DNA-binding protein n=1 Tax=Candidatus Jorgensenbacteria bacterium GWA1_54_12 TaxID=1798468 RepID=A0A1F6BLE4_9BACT|nr:MAG: hypothetical protein A2110_00875 [Candidatus Jorgensenbacteria bacterium GWA1_54_12]
MDLNKVFLIGRLTADPELRTTGSGTAVGNFSVATNRTWKNQSGAREEQTEFHNVVVWGRQAELAHQFLKKGATVMVEGRLQTRTWEGRDGAKNRRTEVVAERVQFGPQAGGTRTPNRAPQQGEAPKEEKIPEIALDEGGEIDSGDMPF